MSISQGEHTFDVDVLKEGKKLRGFTAGEDLPAGEPVAITGSREVTAATDGGPAIGLTGYSVAAGEEVVILSDDCEVRAPAVDGAVSPGDEVTPTGNSVDSGNPAFDQAASADNSLGIAVTSGGGDVTEVYLTISSGVTA